MTGLSLTQFITEYLGTTITTELGTVDWVAFAVSDVLEAYGVSTEADATDLVKLHALAKVKAWEGVIKECFNSIDFSADNARYSLEQLYNHAKEMLLVTSYEAASYLPSAAIETGDWTWPDDPYDRVEGYEA